MTDSIAVLPPGFRVTDANGAPVSGAKLKFFAAGTSTPLTVYSDSTLGTSLGTEVTCDSAGYPTSDGNAKTLVYTGTSSLKITITDSADVTIAEHDNVRAATDTSSFSGGGSGTWSTSVTSNTTDFTVSTSNDAGELKNCDPSGGNFTATLPSAVTAGDGFRVGFRHAGTANQVLIATVSGQAIKLPGGSTTAGFALTGLGHTAWLVSDGAGWTVDLETKPLGDGVIIIADRLTSPPASPTPGARYLINGTPTGDWASFSEHDIVEADGQGSWIDYTPSTDAGWLGYVQDENLLVQFRDSAWVDLDNITAPSASDLKIATYSHTETSGTNGGLVSSLSTWTTRKMNTTDVDTIGITESGASDYEFTIPVGTYLLFGWQHHANGGLTKIRFANADQSIQIEGASRNNSSDLLMIQGRLEVTTEEAFVFEYNRAANGNTTDLGTAVSKGTEVYAQFTLLDLSSIQGPKGEQGDQGPAGPGYQATSTTSLAIGTGSKVFTTQSGLAYTAGARVKAASAANTANYMAGVVASYSGTTLTVTVDDTGGSGTHADWNLNISGETGADGADGATGAAGQTLVDYTFDAASTTDADPGSGNWRANNATAASVTEFYVDDLDRLGVNQATELATWDDSTSTGTKAKLYIEDLTSGERWTYDLTAVTTNSGYSTLAVTHGAGTGSFASNNINVVMVPRGDKGADGAGSGDVVGPASAGDGRVATFNTTTGKLIQDGGKTIAEIEASAAATAESNIRDGVGTAFDTLDEVATSLGNKIEADSTDTLTNKTIDANGTGNSITNIETEDIAAAAKTGSDTKLVTGTEGSANQVAMWNGDGDLVGAAATNLGAGKHALFIASTSIIPRTTNGPEEASAELATNDIALATLNFDTTTEEGAGFFLPMPKSWNEGTVTFRAYWTAASGSGGVAFGLAAYALSDSDAIDAAPSGQQVVTDTLLTADDMHITSESSAITIGGTPAEGDVVYFEITREVANGSDTLGVDAKLIGIQLFITTDALTDA